MRGGGRRIHDEDEDAVAEGGGIAIWRRFAPSCATVSPRRVRTSLTLATVSSLRKKGTTID